MLSPSINCHKAPQLCPLQISVKRDMIHMGTFKKTLRKGVKNKREKKCQKKTICKSKLCQARVRVRQGRSVAKGSSRPPPPPKWGKGEKIRRMIKKKSKIFFRLQPLKFKKIFARGAEKNI